VNWVVFDQEYTLVPPTKSNKRESKVGDIENVKKWYSLECSSLFSWSLLLTKTRLFNWRYMGVFIERKNKAQSLEFERDLFWISNLSWLEKNHMKILDSVNQVVLTVNFCPKESKIKKLFGFLCWLNCWIWVRRKFWTLGYARTQWMDEICSKRLDKDYPQLWCYLPWLKMEWGVGYGC